jgi:hypothetical protein
VEKTCERPGCGKSFEAKRSTRRFCSPDCRVRAHQAPKPAPARRRRRGRPYLETSVRRELTRAGQAESWAGRQALMLAKRLDDSAGESLAAVASAQTALASAMERALRADSAADPIGERADRAERRLRAVRDDAAGA